MFSKYKGYVIDLYGLVIEWMVPIIDFTYDNTIPIAQVIS